MKKILIAEDDLVNQELLRTIIEEMGHVAFVSPNGKHAYETLRSNSDFKLLISDMMMPEMTGKELVQTLRGNSQFENLPIIMISGVIGPSELSHLLDIGVTYFMSKPVKKMDIEEYVNKCLKK